MVKGITFFKSKYKWYLPLLIVIIICIGVFTSINLYQNTIEKNKELLLERTKTISSFVEARDIDTLESNISDTEKPQYKDIKNHLQKALSESKDFRFLYLMTREGNETKFLIDSENEDSLDYSAPGDIYEDESVAIDEAFLGKASVEGPTKDTWGVWFSGLAPIVNQDNKVVAIFGIDVASDRYIKEALTEATIPLIITIFLVIILIVARYFQIKEEKTIEMRSKFVAIASHEIRSPLTGISWAIQSLEKENLGEETKALIKKVSINISNLIETINDILGITEVNTGDRTKDKSINLKTTLQEVIKDTELMRSKRFIDLEFGTDIPENQSVVADPEKMKQVFANILSNAIKYSKENSKINISFNSEKNSIIIKDSGVGIPKDEINKILSGFYRASNVKKDFNGSGLGLYYAKQIMEMYGGKIDIVSDLGKGTEIHLSFKK